MFKKRRPRFCRDLLLKLSIAKADEKYKTMKKLIVLSLVISLTAWVLAPALTMAITTGLTRSTGGGANPIIKAKWEMNGPYANASSWGTDDSPAPGAQFMPTGIWGDRTTDPDAGEKKFSICTIVTDPDGMPDLDRVFADWYYPSDRAFHPVPAGEPDEINGGPAQGNTNPNDDVSPDYDYGVNGCSLPVEDENELFPLSKLDGYNLFCDAIRNRNYNLPTFYPGYDYDEICGAEGELMKETAVVYCVDKVLEWEDPAGLYKVEVLAQDDAGLYSYETAPNTNNFEYLPLTGYEVDFNNVNYGSVKLNTHKVVSGDLTFSSGDGKPSVRNVGNTRLYMAVKQDDMGLGTTDGNWNVEYDARVGNNSADWRYYDPDETQWLEDILDLSEVEEMDFSILVKKFPSLNGDWSGDMWLDSQPAEFRQCGE